MVAFGVAELYKRYSFVRLPGGGLLFYEEKQPKVIQGSALKTRNASVRPDRKVYDLPDLGLDDAYKVDF